MNGHHLILGKTIDFITGASLDDTHDERYRQKIARMLVEQKGYLKSDIIPKKELVACAGTKKAMIWIDFVIEIDQKVCMLIKYGPGSIVTRTRPAVAACRILMPYVIPYAVVTNGVDAQVLDVNQKQVLGKGFPSIPDKKQLAVWIKDLPEQAVSDKQRDLESRILYAYEIDGACPCDNTICRL